MPFVATKSKSTYAGLVPTLETIPTTLENLNNKITNNGREALDLSALLKKALPAVSYQSSGVPPKDLTNEQETEIDAIFDACKVLRAEDKNLNALLKSDDLYHMLLNYYFAVSFIINRIEKEAENDTSQSKDSFAHYLPILKQEAEQLETLIMHVGKLEDKTQIINKAKKNSVADLVGATALGAFLGAGCALLLGWTAAAIISFASIPLAIAAGGLVMAASLVIGATVAALMARSHNKDIDKNMPIWQAEKTAAETSIRDVLNKHDTDFPNSAESLIKGTPTSVPQYAANVTGFFARKAFENAREVFPKGYGATLPAKQG